MRPLNTARITSMVGAVALTIGSASLAMADDIKVGVLLGFTGPIESLTPDMAEAAELALEEVTASGALLDGRSIVSVRGDSTCIDSAAATASAERLVTSDSVVAIMGADCSGVTIAVTNNVAVPNGIVIVSPSATSPALTTIEDNGLFFRTAPSDARQGEVIAEILVSEGVTSVAVTYTNNDYGKGLAASFEGAFQALGGSVAATVPHEDGKGDYSAEVANLAASGAEHLAVFGYADQGGKGIIQASVDTGAFENFVIADGMIGDAVIEALGDAAANTIGTLPGSDAPEAAEYASYAMDNGRAGDCPFCGNAYDAAALIALAIQAAGSTDSAAVSSSLLGVANAPGEAIGPGDLARGLALLAEGSDIDYVGATGVELTDIGESFGSYKRLAIVDGAFETVSIH